jgi:hypothetical protein
MSGGNDLRRLSRLAVIAIGACSIVIAIGLGVLVVDKFLVFLVEEVGENQSVWVYTRFRALPAVNTGPGPVTLMAFMFPGSQPNDEVEVNWYGEPPQPKGQLTVLRFTTQESLLKISDWYAHKLGDQFVESKGWLEPDRNDRDGWVSRVEKTADPDAFVFRQTLGQRVRGVLLQMPPGDPKARITLYDYHR